MPPKSVREGKETVQSTEADEDVDYVLGAETLHLPTVPFAREKKTSLLDRTDVSQ